MNEEQTVAVQASAKTHKVFLKISKIALIVAALAVVIFGLMVTHGKVTSAYEPLSVAVDQPFEVEFSQYLLRVPLDEIKITPKIEGTWSRQQSLSDGNRLTFEHAEPFQPGTKYTVSFTGVRRMTGLATELPDIVFETEVAPGVQTISLQDQKILAADEAIKLVLAQPNRDMRRLVLETEPKVKTDFKLTDDKEFTWRPTALWPQGKQLKLKIIDQTDDSVLIEQTIKIADQPRLESRPPEVGFGPDDSARLVFADAINTESGEISFSTDGSGEWLSDKIYQFKPSKVTPGERYSFTLPKDLRSKAGGILTKQQSYNFAPNSHVTVASFAPHGQELSAKRQEVRVGFNQPVKQASAEQRVVLSHGKITSRRWEGNTLVMVAENFGVQQTVGVTVQAGIEPVFGLPSNQAFRHSFTTEVPVKKLNVPMFYQVFDQSCEAADVRMALAYKGVGGLNDWQILQKFGYKPSSLNKNKNTWDDPQKQFVGDVKGNQGAGTGWGVYAEPVAKAVRGYGRSAEVQYGVTAGFLASNIHAGNPVVLWGIWGESAAQRTWTTPDGKKVSGPFPMHVRLVVGVKGKKDNPIGFYIHDPITGPAYWTTDYLLQNTRKAGAANQAVAVQ